jgi:hypothetical protein
MKMAGVSNINININSTLILIGGVELIEKLLVTDNITRVHTIIKRFLKYNNTNNGTNS